MIAALSDIHGNLPALRAVMADVRSAGAQLVVSCGDIVSGPLPRETLDYVMALDLPFRSVRGNADRAAVEAFDGRAEPAAIHADDLWAGQQLDRRRRDYLAALPPTLSVEIAGLGSVLFCHGTPRRDDDVVVETTSEQWLRAALADATEDVVVCGNTHMQFDRRVGRHRLVNPGSVGWPYGRAGAYWALLGPGVELRCSLYDLSTAAEELRSRSGWPRLERFIALLGRPPSQDEALRFFADLSGQQQSRAERQRKRPRNGG